MAKAKKSSIETGELIEIDIDRIQSSIKLPPLALLRDEGYVSPHIEARLDPEQAQTLRRLFEALDEEGQRLKNGRRVVSNADVVRWLLEAIADVDPLPRGLAEVAAEVEETTVD